MASLIIGTRGRRLDPKLHMACLVASGALGQSVVVLPPHMHPVDTSTTDSNVGDQILTCSPEFAPDFAAEYPALRETPRQRSHPNEPFYRGLDRRRRRW